MKKFLSALLALTLIVSPTGNTICGAEEPTRLVKNQSAINDKKNEVSKKLSAAMKSFKEVVKEHGKEIGLGVAGTASAGVLTWNIYNSAKNPAKIKEILADTTLSARDKFKAILKVVFCGVKKDVTAEEPKKADEQKMEKVKTEKAQADAKIKAQKIEKVSEAGADEKKSRHDSDS